MKSYSLKVTQVVRETSVCNTIYFKQPALKKIKYLPGQYLTLVLNINGRRYKRPYSLSSSMETDITLNITVKRVMHGVVSNHLIDLVKEGDIIEVLEPLGNFTYDAFALNKPAIFLWGAGSGITPLFSIIKSALKNSSQQVHLYYCNSTIEETIFYKELLLLKEEYAQRFFLNLFLTRENTPGFTSGRISPNDVRQAISHNNPDNTVHYICGPVNLKETIKATLIAAGLSDTQIYTEDFEHYIDEKALEGVETRYVSVEKDGQVFDLEVVRGRSVLEACLDSGIDMPYSCQTGNCTLCLATLLSGEVRTVSSEEPQKEIAPNERLLCCSYPVTSDVKLKITNTQ